MKELTPLTNRMDRSVLMDELTRVMDEFNNLVGEYYDFIKEFYGEEFTKYKFISREYYFAKMPYRGYDTKSAIISDILHYHDKGVMLEKEFAREKEVAIYVKSEDYTRDLEERESRKNELICSKTAVYDDYKNGVTKLFEPFCLRHSYKVSRVSWDELTLRNGNDYIYVNYSEWDKQIRFNPGTIYFSMDVTSMCQTFSELLCQKPLLDGFVEKLTEFRKTMDDINKEIDDIDNWINMHVVGYAYNNFHV